MKHPALLVLCPLSAICAMILCGAFLYSGSLLPSTHGVSPVEARSIWIQWGVIVAIPAFTILWLVIGLVIYFSYSSKRTEFS